MEGKSECNIKMSDSDVILEDRRLAELTYDFFQIVEPSVSVGTNIETRYP